MNDVTQIINRLDCGDADKAGELLPLVYDELRRLAASRMQDERTAHTLTPTALVHEAYLRLVGETVPQNWNGRRHFFTAAAEAMRRVLIDHARRRKAAKRGGDGRRLELRESHLVDLDKADELLAMDEVLGRLESADREVATLVKLRFFAGMTIDQAAENMEISPRKADMLWAYGRAWLKEELSEDHGQET